MKSFKDNIKQKTKKIKEKFIFGGLSGGNPFDGIQNKLINVKWLEDIAGTLTKIAEFHILAKKGLFWFVKFIIWMLRFLLYLLEIFNPFNLIKDMVENSFNIPKQLIYAFENLVHNLSKSVTNTLLEPLFNNIFGWDSKEEDDTKDCNKTEKGEISVTLILSTILLPPLGVFMKFGLRSWEDILISGMLTMIFYFPGLVYALIKIFS